MIDIYGKPFCDACEVVCNIVESSGIPYNYHNLEQLSHDEQIYVLRELAPWATTVPIIIVDGRVIGDLNEFRNLCTNAQESTTIRVGTSKFP